MGVDRADAADHAGAKVAFDALQRGGRARLEEDGAELQAMRDVVDPGAAGPHELAGGDRRRVADHGNQIALAAGLHPQDAEPILRVVEGHPFHHPGKGAPRALQRQPCPRASPPLPGFMTYENGS